MNRAAIRRILKASPIAPSAVAENPPADLLTTPVRDLQAPQAVASSVLGETIYLCANDAQAVTVRATGGVPFTPQEVDILSELYQAVTPDVWANGCG